MEPEHVSAMTGLPTIRLRIERRSSHPWIFRKMVERPPEPLPGGTVVDVVDRTGAWVGRGFYNGHSRIGLRILTSDREQQIDETFFRDRIGRAVAFRRQTLQLDAVTDAYRLVHSEGDDLSGLVVDRFGEVVVLQFFAAGMYRFREPIVRVLEEHFPGSRFYWFAEEHIQKQESFNCPEAERPRPVIIREHGLRFHVAVGTKHKTGFFLDQRDNRLALSRLTAGKRVLDLCCNTGGFGIYAAGRGQAEEVVGVDLDEEAIALARRNAHLNQIPDKRIRWIQADLFPWLRDAERNQRRFDVVILDPSKQTRDRDAVDQALRRYVDMNRLALGVVAEDGLLLTCSCTGLVGEEAFLRALRRAAWQAGRSLQVFRVSGAAADHPFLVHVPESRYLTAVWCRVR